MDSFSIRRTAKTESEEVLEQCSEKTEKTPDFTEQTLFERLCM
jgi:hypothetical protein